MASLFSWRLETQQEADERATAEAKADPVARRKAAWAARYALLRFAHSMVRHTKKAWAEGAVCRHPSGLLHPDVAAALREADADPFLQDCHTWRIAGTIKVDGYWTSLRRRVAQRSYKTSSIEALLRAVRIHQWSDWCGSGACLFTKLGAMARRRERRSSLRLLLPGSLCACGDCWCQPSRTGRTHGWHAAAADRPLD